MKLVICSTVDLVKLCVNGVPRSMRCCFSYKYHGKCFRRIKMTKVENKLEETKPEEYIIRGIVIF